VNSRWSEECLAALLTTSLLLGACGGGAPSGAHRGAEERSPGQIDAELLGPEVLAMVDRVMSFRSAHEGKLPGSLRQAGLDSLTPQYVRRLSRQGSDPLVTILFRRPEGHALLSCQGTNSVLEDQSLRSGAFDVSCTETGGGTRTYTVPPPAPPPK
jgi:hypothetical protein